MQSKIFILNSHGFDTKELVTSLQSQFTLGKSEDVFEEEC